VQERSFLVQFGSDALPAAHFERNDITIICYARRYIVCLASSPNPLLLILIIVVVVVVLVVGYGLGPIARMDVG
jgi:hypothetical protein